MERERLEERERGGVVAVGCSRPGGRELGSGWSAPHARERRERGVG